MQNRRDQVQAHLFIMGRLTSGLLRTDLDAPESPVGRTNRGLAMGIVVALLVAAGSFVFGLISPGSSGTWRVTGALIVDEQTGARYLYADGELHPVRNYASALLLVGSGSVSTVQVGHETLRHAPRGAAVGVDGAPDTLPAAGDLTARRPWLVCSTDAGRARTTLAVASAAGGSALASGSAVVVKGPDGTRYLLWQGSRLRIDTASGALESLGYGTVTPRPVSAAFLDAFPAGPDLAPLDVPGLGAAGPDLGGLTTRVGQVFVTRVPGSSAQYYLLRRDGLVPLTDTQAALQLGDPDTAKQAYGGGAASARQVQAGATKGHLADGASTAAASGLPARPPGTAAVPDDSALCAAVRPAGASGSGVQVGVRTVPKSALTATAQADTAGGTAAAACLPVNGVGVEPGSGALVQALSASGGDVDGSTYLVTDTGLKYRVPTDDDLTALGYTSAQVARVPALLLAMLPSGPGLDTDTASTAAAGAGGTGCGSTGATGGTGGTPSAAGSAAPGGTAGPGGAPASAGSPAPGVTPAAGAESAAPAAGGTSR